jgi:oxidase EvaA
MTLGQVLELLKHDDVVNMDTRTVVSCMPGVAWASADGGRDRPGSDAFADAVLHSFDADTPARHSMGEILSWLTEQRSKRVMTQQRVPLSAIALHGWRVSADEIAHADGKYFRVIAVDVRASGREVAAWSQPLLAPREPGLLAFLARPIEGVLHVLVQARFEAGSLYGVEMAPTVHCQPINYDDVPIEARPPYLTNVLTCGRERIRYDAMQSEEGGRFYHATNRYVVVEVEDGFPIDAPDEYRWMTLGQLTSLLTHSSYLNVELRTLIACMRTLA